MRTRFITRSVWMMGNILRVSGSQRSVLGLLLGLITVFIEIVVAVLIISLVGARLMSKRIVAPINEIDLERPLRKMTPMQSCRR